MTTDPIKALVDAAQEFVRKVEAGEAKSTRSYNQFKATLANLKPLADGTHVVVGSVFLNDLRAIADTGGRRIETAMDACDKIIELIDMERQLGPAAPAPSRFEIDGTSQDFYDCEGSDAPAPSDEGVVEKVRKILEEIETETNRATREFHGNSYSAAFAHNRARAALAAIKEEE